MIFGAIFAVSILVFYLIYLDQKYKRSSYYKVTKIPYFTVINDPGYHGEFLIYDYLKSLEAHGVRFLFNVYIPKSNGGTTEIDVLMICPKGIIVFESKNYKGWIFGDENNKTWYQILPAGKGKSRKEAFYNPIMQNQSHIKHLANFLDESVLLHSMIVFSVEATLMDVQIHSPDVTLITRARLEEAVANIYNITHGTELNQKQIDDIYNKLYPCTQVSEEVKRQHRDGAQNASKYRSSRWKE